MGYRSEASQTDKQTDTDNVVYGTQRHRLRQTESQTRGRERRWRISTFWPTSKVSPPALFHCLPPKNICPGKSLTKRPWIGGSRDEKDLWIVTKRLKCENLECMPLCQVGGWEVRSTSSGVGAKVGESSTGIFIPHTKEPYTSVLTAWTLTFLTSIDQIFHKNVFEGYMQRSGDKTNLPPVARKNSYKYHLR